MMNILKFVWIAGLFIGLTLISCKEDAEKVPDDCWDQPSNDLVITPLSPTEVTLPSKISVFFKLDDKDGKPVPNLSESAFSIYEQGLNDDCPLVVSQFEAERKISEKEQVFSYHTLLLLDLSGSVVDSFLPDLQTAAREFINQIIPVDSGGVTRMGIWWFDGAENLHELVPITTDQSELLAGIDGITPAITNDNSTNLYGAVTQIVPVAEQILANTEIITGVSTVIFTDGRDRANRVPRQTAYDAVETADPSINFFTIGLGGEINQNDLEQFGKDFFASASNVAQLSETFLGIAQLVNDEANSYYLFEYCSPIRNGASNTLILEVNAKNKKGFLETSFDATGFTGGCSL